jgi:hypothetical protein
MMIWGGAAFGAAADDGAAYDPLTGAWTLLQRNSGTPGGRSQHSAVASEREMFIWGGNDVPGPTSTGALYCFDACTPTVAFRDLDGDGYGDPGFAADYCTVPAGFVVQSGDCDDSDAARHPGASEVCLNRADDDCDGISDESCPLVCADADVDLFDDCSAGCNAAIGEQCGDCDDLDPATNPLAVETCDGVDNDCNDAVDDGVTHQYCGDADGDGLGDAADCLMACTAPAGHVGNSGDNCPAVSNPNQLDSDSDGHGDVCDFTLLQPVDGFGAGALGTPPRFEWVADGQSTYRVEFSVTPAPFSVALASSKKPKPGASWTATKKKWKKIAKLVPGGGTVYWRVLGHAGGPTGDSVSDQTFSLVISP